MTDCPTIKPIGRKAGQIPSLFITALEYMPSPEKNGNGYLLIGVHERGEKFKTGLVVYREGSDSEEERYESGTRFLVFTGPFLLPVLVINYLSHPVF